MCRDWSKLCVRMAMLLPVLLSAGAVAMGQQPAVGWSLEFEDPADLESAVVGVVGKNRVAAPPRAITDVAVSDGILRLGARFNADSQNDQYVTINWGDELIRHFPFGFRLEPIQARNVSYSNNLRLPRV